MWGFTHSHIHIHDKVIAAGNNIHMRGFCGAFGCQMLCRPGLYVVRRLYLNMDVRVIYTYVYNVYLWVATIHFMRHFLCTDCGNYVTIKCIYE